MQTLTWFIKPQKRWFRKRVYHIMEQPLWSDRMPPYAIATCYHRCEAQYLILVLQCHQARTELTRQ